ncbi:beta-ketoacyl-ACP synthase II [Massilia sp. B-10]|nr:beta-ketoacyl-ACP synthase II [Massilia sp. B-10]
MSRSRNRRVVITGLGAVSPIGNTLAETWSNALAGKSGIANITRFDAEPFSTRFAGEVKGFNIEDYIPAKDARHMDTFIHFGMAAGIQALQDSGLVVTEENADRIGVIVGSGIGGLPLIEETKEDYTKRGPRRISPFFVPASIINMISGNLSIKYGLRGPNLAIVTACTTGLHSIGAVPPDRVRRRGRDDCAWCRSDRLAAGSGRFRLGALSSRNDDPATASRPWDRDRDGFVLGEGAGVMVLEEYEHAKARGARIYAELLGFGMSADAYHMTSPVEDGSGASRCMVSAMNNAGVNRDQVDYVNAHGTSTPLGDLAEVQGIKKTFGDHASKLVVNSTKSMTGHLLGGSDGPGSGVYRAGDASSDLATDDQHLQPGSGLRSRFLRQYRVK